jgi:polyhydroxyalkanoate synthesis regulator phasin
VLQNTGLVESINTLKYASKAKRIKNKTHQNHQNNIDECTDNEELYNKIVEKLKTHVEELKSQILSLKCTQTHQNGKHKRRYSLPKPT